MRPADENQHSTRPNLMSSGRRSANDQSILEMLDRDTGRGASRKHHSRLGWYGAGAALACGLVGLLAWLTHDGPPLQQAQPIVVADTPAAVDHAARADPASELLTIADLDDPPRPHHAAVIDERPVRQPGATSAAAATVGHPGHRAGSAAGALVQDDVDAATSRARDSAMPDHAAAAPALATALAPQARAAHTGAATGHGAPAASQRATADAAKSRAAPRIAQASTQGPPRKLSRGAARARKPAAVAKPAPAPVDSDVALISAVIQHSSARADPGCSDGNCAAKTTPQP